ncbi:MAG: NAD(P)H-dependent oxidoreductase subunit E [Nanoarchaeota archaeon]
MQEDHHCENNKEMKNIIELLHNIQEEEGFLSKFRLERLSTETGVPLSKIYGIITFYSYFKLNKAAKNKIQICDGTACHVRGSEKLLSETEKCTNISEGEITEDGKFSIEIVRCLGMCASAPIIKINEDVYPTVAPKDIESILEKYS